jgi:hypothetical protein
MRAELKSFWQAIAWLAETMGRVSRRQVAAFTVATLLMGLLRITQFLVTVLPLKVLLLASHVGVPSYAPFINPDHKQEWLIGLAIGTIVAYVMVQFLDSFTERICKSAGTRLMNEAAMLSVVPNQHEKARTIFSDLASVLADSLFWCAGMVLYLVMAPTTFAVYSALVLGSLALGTVFVVAGSRHPFIAPAHQFITENTNTYLSTNSTAIFFLCFLAILYPYITGVPENMLIGLVSIMLLRRTLGAALDAVRGSIRLIRKRPLVDTLMFRNRQLVSPQKADQAKATQLFASARRTALVETMLTGAGHDTGVQSVEWMDPVVPNVLTFKVVCKGNRHYQLHAFPTGRLHDVENEEALFSLVDRHAVGAAPVVQTMEHGAYFCRLLEAGEGRAPGSSWGVVREDALVRLCSVKPGEELVEMYGSTHLLAYQKLTPDFVKRMRFSLSSQEDRMIFNYFVERLDEIRSRLSALPLVLCNRTFTPNGSVMDASDRPIFMYWGYWSLEPLGGWYMPHVPISDLEGFLSKVREHRDDIGADVTALDLFVAGRVQKLIGCLDRGSYAEAFRTIVEIQNSKLIPGETPWIDLGASEDEEESEDGLEQADVSQ